VNSPSDQAFYHEFEGQNEDCRKRLSSSYKVTIFFRSIPEMMRYITNSMVKRRTIVNVYLVHIKLQQFSI